MGTLVNVATFSVADPPVTTTPGTDFLRNL
jgi:hypothetical protein